MEDFLKLDQYYSSEEILIRDTVRQYVDNEVIPKMPALYENAEFPREFIDEMAKLGLLGMTLPENMGGSNASKTAYGLVCQELERGDSGLRSFVSVQSSLCMYPIFKFGTEEQQQRFLAKMAKAELIACFGLTEPDSGSNPASMKTVAKKVDGGWLLNGSKLWITNAPIADLAIVWAKTDDGVRGFIIEKDFEGFQRSEIKHKLSLRASSTGELSLQDCFVPDDNYLPGTEKGLGTALSCLTQARYGIAWGAMGAAMAAYEIALNYVKQRKQFNKAIASFQLVQKDLATMFMEIVKAQTLNFHIARLHDKEEATPVMISLAKKNACEQALTVTRMARNLLGANGISLEYHVIRHMNNLESVYTYEGTDNIHTLILGQYLTGISAFE